MNLKLLHDLLDLCEQSEGHGYGTLSSDTVKKMVEEAIAPIPHAEAKARNPWEAKAMQLAFAMAEQYGYTGEVTITHSDALLQHLRTAPALGAPALPDSPFQPTPAQDAAATVPEGLQDRIDAMGAARYKVVASDQSMFYRHAVVAGDGKQQLYLGREVECQNMAAKFTGAFLDGAFACLELLRATPPAPQVAPTAAQPKDES